MPIDPDTFRAALGRFASGVTVMTTRSSNADLGMTVNAFCSVSLEPPLVLACIDRQAEQHDQLADGQRVVFNILSASQEALSRRFSEEEGSRRFDQLGFDRDRHGVAVLHDVVAWIAGRITRRYDGGDHSIFLVEIDVASTHDLRPLLYYRGGYAELER